KPGLFKRAALVCPAIASLSRNASDEEKADYIKRNRGADLAHVEKAQRLLDSVFPDDATWQAAAPVAAGSTLLGAATPPLHVSCGDKDEYGFYEGAHAFAQLAASKGVAAVWETLSG